MTLIGNKEIQVLYDYVAPTLRSDEEPTMGLLFPLRVVESGRRTQIKRL